MESRILGPLNIMEQKTLTINVNEYEYSELSVFDRQIVDEAIEATKNSYAPYSNFNVGAAIRLSDGSIVRGANQENAAFPVGLCAERAAIFAAQSATPELAITDLAIAAKNVNGLMSHPISPCGSCRQVILEMEERYKQPIRILLYGTEKVYQVDSVRDLLPLCFVDGDMR